MDLLVDYYVGDRKLLSQSFSRCSVYRTLPVHLGELWPAISRIVTYDARNGRMMRDVSIIHSELEKGESPLLAASSTSSTLSTSRPEGAVSPGPLHEKSSSSRVLWDDLAESDGHILDDSEVAATLRRHGLPHKSCDSQSFKTVPRDSYPEFVCPEDPLFVEGLGIGRTGCGRGGLPERLRTPVGRSCRGGVKKLGSPPRLCVLRAYI